MKHLFWSILLSFSFLLILVLAPVSIRAQIPTPTPAPTVPPSPAPAAGVTIPPTGTPPPRGSGSVAPLGSGTSGVTPALNFSKIAGLAGVTMPANLGEIITSFIPYVFGIAGIVLFLYLIWGGYGLLTSQGDPKATQAGKDRITRAIVGYIIIFTAYWVVQILGLILGISDFNSIFP